MHWALQLLYKTNSKVRHVLLTTYSFPLNFLLALMSFCPIHSRVSTIYGQSESVSGSVARNRDIYCRNHTGLIIPRSAHSQIQPTHTQSHTTTQPHMREQFTHGATQNHSFTHGATHTLTQSQSVNHTQYQLACYTQYHSSTQSCYSKQPLTQTDLLTHIQNHLPTGRATYPHTDTHPHKELLTHTHS